MENDLSTYNHATLERKTCRGVLEAWSKVFEVEPPVLVFVPLKHAAEQQGRVIRLSTTKKDGRCPITVAHEFAHYLMAHYDRDDRLAQHGPEFVGVMMSVCEVGGVMPRPAMEWLAARREVEYLDTKHIRSPGGLSRMVKHRASARRRSARRK